MCAIITCGSYGLDSFFQRTLKPYLFACPNPISAIISWIISWTINLQSYHTKQKDGYSLPTNDPTNNGTNWIWTSKKIGLYLANGLKLRFYVW